MRKQHVFSILQKPTSSSADGEGTETRVRAIEGLTIGTRGFGSTSEVILFSNEVRLHGVRVGSTLASSSKSNTDVS